MAATDTVKLSSIRVVADMDSSGYVAGAQAKVKADQAMIDSGKAAGAAVSGTVGHYETLRQSATGVGVAHYNASTHILGFRQMLTLATAAASGNVTMMARQGALLTNVWGGLAGATGLVTISLGAMVAVLATAIMRQESTERMTAQFSATLQGLGDSAGKTAGNLTLAARAVQAYGTSAQTATALVQQGLRSGYMNAGNVQQSGQLALDISAARGGDPTSAMQKMIDIARGGYPVIHQLNAEWGFMSAQQEAVARGLAASGNAAGAVKVAMDALQQRYTGAYQKSLTDWDRQVNALSNTWGAFTDKLAKNVGIPVLDRLERMVDVLNNLSFYMNLPAQVTPGILAENTPGTPEYAAKHGATGGWEARAAIPPDLRATTMGLDLAKPPQPSAADTARATYLQTQGEALARLMAVGEAYQQSEARGLQVAAEMKAANDNITRSTAEATSGYHELVTAIAAFIQQSAQGANAAKLQADQAKYLADAARGGPGALRGAELQVQIENANYQRQARLTALQTGSGANLPASLAEQRALSRDIATVSQSMTSVDQSTLERATNLSNVALERQIAEKKTEYGMMFQSLEARNQELATIRAKNELEALGWTESRAGFAQELADRVKSNQELATYVTGIERANEAHRNMRQDLHSLASFGENAFRTLTDTSSTWEDKLKSIGNALADLIFKLTVIQPLERAIEGSSGGGGGLGGGLFSWLFGGAENLGAAGGAIGGGMDAGTALSGVFALARGAAFYRGRPIEHFATGSVFSQPTYFGMSGGGLGQLGEDGPEGVLPLTRTSSGKLGVQATGAGRGGNTYIIDARGADAGVEERIEAVIKRLDSVDASIERRAVTANVHARALAPRMYMPRYAS